MDTPVTAGRFWITLPVLRGWHQVRDYYRLSQGLGFVGGSYAAFMCSNINPRFHPSDIDIFAMSADAQKEIARRLKEKFGMYQETRDLVICLTPGGKRLPVQVIQPHPDWHRWPDDILNSFDFDVSRAVLVRHDRVLADQNVGLTEGKILRINNPLKSLQRVVKYGQKGVSFPTWELCKLFEAWDALTPVRRAEIMAQADVDREDRRAAEIASDFVSEDEYWEGEG